MDFLIGSTSLALGKIKLGSDSVDKIYFNGNLIWPPQGPSVFCSIEGTASSTYSFSICSIEGTASASYSFNSCAIEGQAII